MRKDKEIKIDEKRERKNDREEKMGRVQVMEIRQTIERKREDKSVREKEKG